MGTEYQGEEWMQEDDVMTSALKHRSSRTMSSSTTTTTTTTDNVMRMTSVAAEGEGEGKKQRLLLEHERSIYYDNKDGPKSVAETHDMKYSFVGSSTAETKLENMESVVQTSSPMQVIDQNSNFKESKEVVAEWDVKRVLDEQQTHHLFCPKCNSCITRRVILRKRKHVPYNPKSENTETDEPTFSLQQPPPIFGEWSPTLGGSRPPVGTNVEDQDLKLGVGKGSPTLGGSPPPAGTNVEHQDLTLGGSHDPVDNGSDEEPRVKPKIYRCLSCFIFFIPSDETISNIKSFRFFGGGNGSVPNAHQPLLTEGATQDVTLVIEGEQVGPNILQTDGTTQTKNVDILKSIVYGGLVESITSLCIISSAAGGDITTMNIVALALANLISGFFLIMNRLVGMKNEEYDSANNQNGMVDRYHELLGNRRNFSRHAIFVILSYLVFGMVAPITYGFSFRESDNKEYKLIVVAASSLLCIILLAITKAYVRNSPKAYKKTIMNYVSIGVASSGLSYVAGIYANKLFEKFGWFNSVHSTPTFLEPMAVKSLWTSY